MPAAADTLSGAATGARHIPHVEISAQSPGDSDPALAPLSTTLISARTLEAAHTPSLLPTLQSHVPSLFITGRSVLGYGLSTGAAGTLKVRGVGSEKGTGVLVVMDGEPMVQGLMGHTVADTYQSLGATEVEVVRGPASVRYGSDAMAGVIQIRTASSTASSATPEKNPKPTTRLQAQAAYGTYETLNSGVHLHHTGRRGFALTAAASYDRTEGHRDNLGFRQASAFARLSQRLTSHWQLALQAYGTRFTTENPGTTDAPLLDAQAQATRGLASLSLRHQYAATEGSLRAYYTYGDHHIDDGHTADAAPLNYQFRSQDFIRGLQLDETLRPWRGATLAAGLEARQYGGKAWNAPLHHDGDHATQAHTAPAYLIDTTLWSVGTYLCLGQTLGDMTIDGGLRYERDAASGEAWVPQLGLTYRPARPTTLRLLASRGFRAPSLRELYLWASANPELRAERLTNYEVSVEQWWCRHRLRTQITLYHLRAQNLIETVYEGGRAQNRNLGRQRNRGVEVELAAQLSRSWHYATHYSYLHTQQAVTGAPRHAWHQELSFTTARWRLAPSLQYVDHLYTALSPTLVAEHYLLLHLMLEFRPTRYIQIFARGENLTGERYETIQGYPMPRATAMGGIKLTLP
jgi:outer membrane cobalamin receptor